MKKSTASAALAAAIGLSAWSMTAAIAVAPGEAPAEPTAVTTPAPSVDGMGQGGDGTGPLTPESAPGPEDADLVIPDWSRDLDNSVSCADAQGTQYVDYVPPAGVPAVLDADGDGITCESNGDDDAARGVHLDPWGGNAPALNPGYEFPNCDTAYAGGGHSYPFPVSWYPAGAGLDPDGDGMACETNGDDDAAFTGVVHHVPLATDVDPESQVPEAEAPEADAPATEAPVADAPEAPTTAAPAAPAAEAPAADAPEAEAPAAPATAEKSDDAEAGQVEEVPVGGADTGAVQPSGRTALLAGGGLVALVGAGLLGRQAIKR